MSAMLKVVRLVAAGLLLLAAVDFTVADMWAASREPQAASASASSDDNCCTDNCLCCCSQRDFLVLPIVTKPDTISVAPAQLLAFILAFQADPPYHPPRA